MHNIDQEEAALARKYEPHLSKNTLSNIFNIFHRNRDTT